MSNLARAAYMLLLGGISAGLLVGSSAPRCSRGEAAMMGLHDLTATTMKGEELALSELKGKKVVALNVASK